MIKRVQIIGHITTTANAFIGKIREVTADITKNTLRVHDGSTPGGIEIAKADATNIIPSTNVQDGKMTASQVVQLEANTSALSTHIGAGGVVNHSVATGSVEGFMSVTDKNKLDGIEALAKDDLTGAEILALLLPVDGAGSNLDADLVDGLNPTITGVVNSLMRRDAAGRAQVVSPAVTNDIATKGYADSLAAFTTGTRLLFPQASVPTGWTLVVTHNDRVLRVVSGSGGGVGGNWTMVGMTINNHTLTESQIPSHVHAAGGIITSTDGDHAHTTTIPGPGSGGEAGINSGVAVGPTVYGSNINGDHSHTTTGNSAGTGGGTGHNHGITNSTWRPSYLDSVIGSRN